MINLGSPDSTSIPDVKKYLDEFLMDKRVIGKSYWFRWFLVKVIILNIRPRYKPYTGNKSSNEAREIVINTSSILRPFFKS